MTVSIELGVETRESIRFPDESGRSLLQLIESCPPGSIVDLAPGRYTDRLVLRRGVTLRGAGDLTRISVDGRGSAIIAELPPDDVLTIESVLIEGGEADEGGALFLRSGVLRLHNVHIRECRAGEGGGAIHLSTGVLEATLLRAHDVHGDRGGAICAVGDAIVRLKDAQIHDSQARYGGAMAFLGPVRAHLEGITIGKSHATVASGGQAIYVAGAGDGKPVVDLVRVRLEDAPLGMPLVVDRDHPGAVSLYECDMPRVVLDAPGVVDGGANNWR
jgi:hypothetical protein